MNPDKSTYQSLYPTLASSSGQAQGSAVPKSPMSTADGAVNTLNYLTHATETETDDAKDFQRVPILRPEDAEEGETFEVNPMGQGFATSSQLASAEQTSRYLFIFGLVFNIVGLIPILIFVIASLIGLGMLAYSFFAYRSSPSLKATKWAKRSLIAAIAFLAVKIVSFLFFVVLFLIIGGVPLLMYLIDILKIFQ